jgi:opacity protein-like surface antigen
MLRVEGELSYRHGEIKRVDEVAPPGNFYRNVDGSLGIVAMMANVFFDLENPSMITPYFGAGAGIASLHLSDTEGTTSTSPIHRDRIYDKDDASVFAYQAGLGMEFAINPRFSLDLGYRYFRTAEATFDSAQWNIERRLKIENHSVALGFRAKF